MMDIMEEARTRIPDQLEIDGATVPIAAVIADDNLRSRAIETLDAKLEPYTNKDFPSEITVAWITWLYLQAKDREVYRRALEKVL